MCAEKIKAKELLNIIDLSISRIESGSNITLKLNNSILRVEVEKEMYNICLDEDFEQWKYDEIINQLNMCHELQN